MVGSVIGRGTVVDTDVPGFLFVVVIFRVSFMLSSVGCWTYYSCASNFVAWTDYGSFDISHAVKSDVAVYLPTSLLCVRISHFKRSTSGGGTLQTGSVGGSNGAVSWMIAVFFWAFHDGFVSLFMRISGGLAVSLLSQVLCTYFYATLYRATCRYQYKDMVFRATCQAADADLSVNGRKCVSRFHPPINGTIR